MTGRWCSLVVRGVRRGWLSYSNWEGSRKEILRERLLLDDIEMEMMASIAPFYLTSRAALNQVMPWTASASGEDALDGSGVDPDKLYEEVMNAHARKPIQ